MADFDVTAYIAEKLEAGESPADIAASLHARGYTVQDPQESRFKRFRQRLNSKSVTYAFGVLTSFTILIIGIIGINAFEARNNSTNPEIRAESEETEMVREVNDLSATDSASTTEEIELDEDSQEASPSSLIEMQDQEDATASAQEAETSSPSARLAVSQTEYDVALIGDSMIDTFESHLPELEKKLEEKYEADFTIYNYGIGSENVSMGLERLNQPFDYQGRSYPAVTELEPDIIILGSFAYNPFVEHDLNQYWLTMALLIEESLATGADLYLLAEVAPVREEFGEGSLDWTLETRIQQAEKVVEQLESFLALSETKNVPLIDTYTLTQAEDGFGDGVYTNEGDGIHASDEGKELMIEEIMKAVEVE